MVDKAEKQENMRKATDVGNIASSQQSFGYEAHPLAASGLGAPSFMATVLGPEWAMSPPAYGGPVGTHHSGSSAARSLGTASIADFNLAQGWPTVTGGDNIVTQAGSSYSFPSIQPDPWNDLDRYLNESEQVEYTPGSSPGVPLSAYYEAAAEKTGVAGVAQEQVSPPLDPAVGQLQRPGEEFELPLQDVEDEYDFGFSAFSIDPNVNTEDARYYNTFSFPSAAAETADTRSTRTSSSPSTPSHGNGTVGDGNSGAIEPIWIPTTGAAWPDTWNATPPLSTPRPPDCSSHLDSQLDSIHQTFVAPGREQSPPSKSA